jgi:prepilin-type N-terminal cleavage/methylation domain-containing protein
VIGRVRSAFTLVESLAALVILAAAAVACLRIGTDAARSRVEIDRALRADREAEALFDMMLTGTMAPPALDPGLGRYVWEGELNGEPYRITREPETIPNPLLGRVGHAVEPTVGVYRYRVERRGRTSEFVFRR